MSPASLVLLFLVPALVVLITLAAKRSKADDERRRSKGKGMNLPPGSMGWPIIGETLAFIKHHPCTSLGAYMEDRLHKYGKVYKSHLLGSPTIVSADPELNEFVLRNDGKLFKPNLPETVVSIIGDNALVTSSAEMHHYLKPLFIDFLGIDRLRGQFFRDADTIFAQTVGAWEENTPFSFKEEASKATFNLMVKNMLSMNPGEPETHKLWTMYDSIHRGLRGIIPRRIPGTAYNKAMQARQKILKVIKELMEERLHKKREGTDSIGENDFLGYMLVKSEVDAEQFLDLVLTMLLAGHGTSTSAITMVVYFLQNCPKAMEQLREEHLNISGNRMQGGKPAMLTWDDYRKMEFTRSVICETLRIGNITGFLPRKAMTDVHYKGYDIPSGWSVILLLSAANLDPSLYQDPQKFNPWRWQAGLSSTTRMDNFLPFGRGRYKCAGGEVANMVVAVFLHHFILNYSWEPVEPDHPSALLFTEFKKGLPIKVRKI